MNKLKLNMVVVESSAVVFEGLISLISRTFPYAKFVNAFSLDELERLSPTVRPDIIFINPSMVQNKTREYLALKRILTNATWVGLVYSCYDEALLSLFDKLFMLTDSPKALQEIISLKDRTNESLVTGNNHEPLSEREEELLKLLINGLSYKEIAKRLCISVHTVISHKKNISKKTGIKSQAGLTIFAISTKLIQLEDYQNLS